MDKDYVVLLAARASRTENQDAIDAAIVEMLADPKEVFCVNYCLFGCSWYDQACFSNWSLIFFDALL